MDGNVMAMRKLENQLTEPAILVAAGLGPCENNSVIINQGMGPVDKTLR
jgi:hypothetical protein